MADRLNESHKILNELLQKIPNNEQLAMRIAEGNYYREIQLSEDYEMIKDRILTELSEISEENIQIKTLTIEAILLVVLKQFEERKTNALRNYMHTVERAKENMQK